MTNEPTSDEVQRWTAKRKAAVALDLIAGKTTAMEVARSHGLTVSEIEQWKSDFITQGTESLRRHPSDLAAQQEAREQQLPSVLPSPRASSLGLLGLIPLCPD